MADIGWLVRRLRAMSVPEVAWRVSQKALQKKEEKLYKAKPVAVTAKLFNERLAALPPQVERLHLNYENKEYVVGKDISLLGGFSYQQYKSAWNAGFQTYNHWPDTFSYSLEYKQRDDIGDARTNWELNRHFQFALLAKNYFASGDKKYLNELTDLFEDWNKRNPFLHGISWTSVMEVAIRASNWCYAYGFLSKSKDVPDELLDKLRIGILNMTDYIAAHYSRYSSANNHLIVEAFVIGQSGILFDYHPWITLSVSILTRELPLQNYTDGVNKELSLHYQSFYMEAMGLMLRLLQKNNFTIPDTWMPMLNKMCKYLADCMGKHGEVIEFGDNDEGKILDLHGGEESHYRYVLGLLSCLLDRRYVDFDDYSENLHWLFTENDMEEAGSKPLYEPEKAVCYREGGNTILRSSDGRALIGIDHAALGFGSIAAHGHADALSFQMYVDGKPVFIDPGTYIYHCDLQSRNEFRKTENHNTVCIGEKDQSEMLGAFLWGKKAECCLEKAAFGDSNTVVVSHNGYAPDTHRRSFKLTANALQIEDEIKTDSTWSISWIVAPDLKILESGSTYSLIACDNDTEPVASLSCNLGDKIVVHIADTRASARYGIAVPTKKIVVSGERNAKISFEIRF